MRKASSSFFPNWIAPRSFSALFNRSALRRPVEANVAQPLDWRRAEPDDWPVAAGSQDDFRHAREGGFGLVAQTASKRVFLAPRGWESPEWALADADHDGSGWRDLGCIEPLPVHWGLPEGRP